MRQQLVWGSILLMAMALFSAGCAKKQIEVEGPSANATWQGDQAARQEMEEDQADLRQGAKDVDEWVAMEDQDQEAQDLELATLREQIYFDFDSFELKPQARTRLKEKAMILEESPKLKVIIEGHCDERGTQEYNLALGERRAKAAYEFLLLLGIDANRLQIVSYGEERPAVKGHNEAAWAKNRRCEFKVYK